MAADCSSCMRLESHSRVLCKVDLLKIDVDSMPHDELLRRLLESGLRPKAGGLPHCVAVPTEP